MTTKAGQLIEDGDAVWILDDVRDGARVGDIILRPTLRDGFIKANGATVKASEYPRLLAWVQESNMTVSVEQYAQDCSKYGETVKSVEAGLPNLKGKVLESFAGGFYARSQRVPFIYESTASFAGQVQIAGGNSSSSILFDASKANPIYGHSDTVQPPAITMIAQIKY